ncbi:MAG: hypothetical protein IPN95_19760 [Bacteroidetes bacterium]|jgi:hypothetical protein|nr:hypothetical protein [Bacteroidota bacterium]MBL0020741.1 hypothetical protein [Bacteroidota bacterium]
MKKTLLFFLLVTVAITYSACKKCKAGDDGTLTIVAFPRHHGADTKPLWAYVKFDAQEFPGTDSNSYDLVIKGDSTENHIELPNLNCGNYFIYEIAYDPAIQAIVTGGIPYSTEETIGEVNVDIPVTE